MNSIKVDSIKFLMTMFDLSLEQGIPIKNFKNNVENLVAKRQISLEVRDIIYSMYGIMNTDVFKPNSVSNKIMQITYLMSCYESSVLSISERNKSFKRFIEQGVKDGSILVSVKDIIFNIYDLSEMSVQGKLATSNIPSRVPKTLKPITPEDKLITYSKEVQKDIDSIKREYLDTIYYEYENPSYDGCSGSTPYKYSKLVETSEKPKGATLCYLKTTDDGCHEYRHYLKVPQEYFKEVAVNKNSVKKEPYIDPCYHGSFGMRSSGC